MASGYGYAAEPVIESNRGTSNSNLYPMIGVGVGALGVGTAVGLTMHDDDRKRKIKEGRAVRRERIDNRNAELKENTQLVRQARRDRKLEQRRLSDAISGNVVHTVEPLPSTETRASYRANRRNIGNFSEQMQDAHARSTAAGDEIARHVDAVDDVSMNRRANRPGPAWKQSAKNAGQKIAIAASKVL